jgi:hypothetical protein
MTYVGGYEVGDTAYDGQPPFPACDQLPAAQIGKTYSLSATTGGLAFTAYACPTDTSVDVRLTVYRRTNACNNAACYACQPIIDSGLGGGCESAQISLVSGESVYLFISGTGVGSNVTFYLTIEELKAPLAPPIAAPTAPLPACLRGSVLSLDSPITASLSDLRTSDYNTYCRADFYSSNLRGDWYRLPAGLTGTIYLSTCDSATQIDTVIMAFYAADQCTTTCSCLACLDAVDDTNGTYSNLCASTRAVLSLTIEESTSVRPVYIFAGAYSAATTIGTYRLVMSRRDPLEYYSPTPLQETSNSSGAPIGAIVGGVIGGVVFLALCVTLIVMRSRRQVSVGGGSTVVMTMRAAPQPTASVVVTQHTPALPPNSPAYVSTVEMQPMQQPMFMQPPMQQQPQMQQMPDSYYT